MTGYHLKTIKKGVYGEVTKLYEELAEYEDAVDQKCEIMALVELSDLYGALEELVQLHHGKKMSDLKAMSDITKRAFSNGDRS